MTVHIPIDKCINCKHYKHDKINYEDKCRKTDYIISNVMEIDSHCPYTNLEDEIAELRHSALYRMVDIPSYKMLNTIMDLLNKNLLHSNNRDEAILKTIDDYKEHVGLLVEKRL